MEEILRCRISRGIQTTPLAVELNHGYVDRDPRWLCRRRVGLAVGQPMRSLPNHAMKSIDTMRPQTTTVSLIDRPIR